MLTLSAFQLLPPHAVKMIVDHVAGCSRLRYDRISNDLDEYKLLQMPLLWVCHNFRAFVYARFCSKYGLHLRDDKSEAVILRLSWPLCLRKIDYPTHRLAKDLYLNLELWSIYTGKAVQLLSSVPYEGCALLLVRQLAINLRLYEERRHVLRGQSPTSFDVYPPDTTANIAAFVKRVKQMAPNIRQVDVSPDFFAESLLRQCNTHLMDLIQQLYGIVKARTAITHGCGLLVEYLDLEPIRDLVHVTYRINATASRIMPLVRCSAQTLQSLELSGIVCMDYTTLVRDPDSGGRWVEYPRLHTLRLNSEYENAISRNSIPNGATPFPKLRCLRIRRAYPFGDDALFRGNAATLEYLEIKLDRRIVAILERHNVFTPTSHPKLKCVNLRLPIIPIMRVFDSAAEYLHFALSIASEAPVRTISGLSHFDTTFSQELVMFGNHANIQILYLSEVTLSIWDVISLIKSLPLLSDLQTLAPSLPALPRGISSTKLPEYMHSTYAPMGERFQCWHICHSSNCKYSRPTTCILLLALVCPNFDCASVYQTHREQFMKEMKKQIAEPRFILWFRWV
ncbi:hypothetical protein GGF42_001237 [Coemansia sp. RSA 2424]|nr:hypothetical protein GGF42_001237 [Coemansia sp. RSA 2424]